MSVWKVWTAVVVLVGAPGGLVHAEDITAKKVLIKDHPDPTKRQVQVQSRDPGVQLSEADNPLANGASVHLYSATDDLCVILPAGANWQNTGSKWKYTDRATRKTAQVADGSLKIKVKSGITYDLADDGSQGTVNAQIQFGTGTRYCLQCPGNRRDDASKFLAMDCPSVPCGPEPFPCSSASTTTTTASSTTTTSGPSTSTTSTVTSSTTTSTAPYCTLVGQWGTPGSGPGEFQNPFGVGVAGNGDVYVADTSNSRIQQFTSTGTYIRQWGTYGTGNGQFYTPVGVSFAAGPEVYVVDDSGRRIQRFTNTGLYLGQWGTAGTGNSQFLDPSGIAVTPQSGGKVYVADTNNHRVQQFTTAGTYVGQWGSAGSGPGQFNVPTGVAVDDQDVNTKDVFIADTYNDRIQQFTNTGTYVRQWGSTGSASGQFILPWSIAARGLVAYVADNGNGRIQQFTTTGTYVGEWGVSARGVAVGATAGDVYVADQSNHRILRFSCPLPAHKRVFITSTLHDGNLGGLAGADAICAARAAAGGLPGTYKAWLSASSSTASSRLAHATVPYANYPSSSYSPHIIADNWNDLTDGLLEYYILYTEFGGFPSTNLVWTGTDYTGANGGSSCVDWTTNSSLSVAGVGNNASVASQWTSFADQSCNNLRALYCFEQ